MTPKLKHLQEFEAILSHYTLSDRAREALEGLRFVAILGPTSSGRNTVIRELFNKPDYFFIVSDTTRPPQVRDGRLEENGVDYFFRSEEDMLEDLKKGEFLEAELIHRQQVSGISLRELEKAKQQNKIAISDMDLGGVTNLMHIKPDAIAIMLLPPNFEEWQKRLSQRGKLSDQEYRRRLETAAKVFADGLAQNYYRYVVSDNVEKAAATIDAIVHSGVNPQEGRAKEILNQLQYELQQKLESMKFI
jgi:guanylate kinase